MSIAINDISCPYRVASNEMLSEIAKKYPFGTDWFDRRMNDVARNNAEYTVLTVRSIPSAWAIITHKGIRRRKLSTFFVSSQSRQLGLGSQLLSHLKTRWWIDEIEKVTVTVDEMDQNTLGFFKKSGFEEIENQKIKYGIDRTDSVLSWRTDVNAQLECQSLYPS